MLARAISEEWALAAERSRLVDPLRPAPRSRNAREVEFALLLPPIMTLSARAMPVFCSATGALAPAQG